MPKIGLVVTTRTRLDEPFRDLVIAREIIAEMQETGALRVPSSILNDFTHGTPAPVCGACLTTPMDAHGLVCASCTSEMTAGESAKRQGSTGHEAAGLWYTPRDEDSLAYAEDVDAPAPPLWASLLALIPGDRESRILALFVATVGCLLIAAILLTAHFAQKAGPPW